MTIPLEVRGNIFVKGLNWVGDAIIATPALRRLRKGFPDSRITLMVRPWVAAVYEHNPDIDELWVMDDSAEFFAAARRVRKGKFTLGIALPNSFRSAALMALGQIPHRVGYSRGARSLLLTRRVTIDPKIMGQNQVYYYLHLIDWMFDQKMEVPKLVLNSGEKERESVAKLLRERGIEAGRPWIGVAPGSINSDAKRWPAERYADLCDRLVQGMKARVFLLGSPQEKRVVDQVASLCKEPIENMVGEIGLGELIAFMERLHAFIGNDSGAMHVAAALDVPTVAIFGPTEWTTTAPFTTKSKIVRHAVECAPCMLRACPLKGAVRHQCMTKIEATDVIKGLAELAPHVKARMAG